MKLILVSGDATIANGQHSTFRRVLETFQQGWERIDVITPPAKTSAPLTQFGNVYIHPVPQGSNQRAQFQFVSAKLTSLIETHHHELVSATVYGKCLNALATSRTLSRIAHPPRLMFEVHHVAGVPRAGGLRDRVERAFVTTFMRVLGHRADVVRAVNTHETPTYLKNVCGISPDKLIVVPSVFYEPEDYQLPETLPKRYDLMFCGRLMPNKGLDLLLATFAAVRRVRPTTTMLIKSSGGLQRQWLEREIARIDAQQHVTIIDWVETPADLVQLYAQSRVLLCTSYNEGGPRVTIEAMVCGTPVVSTRVGVMPDVIQHGTNGFLANWDANELAQYSLRLLEDEQEAQRVGNAGAATVRPFTRDRVIQGYIEAYHAVAQQH